MAERGYYMQEYDNDYYKERKHLYADLDKADDIILINKTHFTVNLCKLWLTVSTKIRITDFYEIRHAESLGCRNLWRYPAWRKDTLPRVRHSEDSDG